MTHSDKPASKMNTLEACAWIVLAKLMGVLPQATAAAEIQDLKNRVAALELEAKARRREDHGLPAQKGLFDK